MQQLINPYDLDPERVKWFERLSETLGSNPGGMHRDPDGQFWYLKRYEGASGRDRAKNEKLTSELYKLAGVPVADARLTEWEGHPAIASPMNDGKKLSEFDPSEYDRIKHLKENYPVDAWLLNYDAMGTRYRNVIVDKDNVAHRLDAGAGLRYRAKGPLKQHFNGNVDELRDMQDPELNKWIAKVIGDWRSARTIQVSAEP